MPASETPLLIKRYPNRRLYVPERGGYISPDELSRMIEQGTEFVVRDAQTGEDITREVCRRLQQ